MSWPHRLSFSDCPDGGRYVVQSNVTYPQVITFFHLLGDFVAFFLCPIPEHAE